MSKQQWIHFSLVAGIAFCGGIVGYDICKSHPVPEKIQCMGAVKALRGIEVVEVTFGGQCEGLKPGEVVDITGKEIVGYIARRPIPILDGGAK
jgi:hypothetical protein